MWILLSIIASIIQTFRNSFQNGLMKEAGVGAATWVRFAFGVPITFLFFCIIYYFNQDFIFSNSQSFWINASIGALAQVLATAALLLAINSSGFAIGIALQHASLIITAVFGVVFLKDHLSVLAWIGMFIISIAMIIYSIPQTKGLKLDIKSAIWGLVSGSIFAVSGNAFRIAVNEVNKVADLSSGTFTVLIVQILQTIFLGLFLFIFYRKNLFIALKNWKDSLKAGGSGAFASILWFTALGLAPAALVRAINLLIETPFSIYVGYKTFKEKPKTKDIIVIFMIIIGVILALIKL